MKKVFYICIIMMICINVMSPISLANEEETLKEQQEELGISEFIEEADAYTGEFFEDIDINQILEDAIKGEVDNQTLFKKVLGLLGGELIESLTVLGSILAIVIIHSIFNALFYPFSGALANGLRAAGDVKFTMYVSIFSTIGCRVVFSILFGILLGMGVVGIAFAMCLDWMIRALFFWVRFRRGKWKAFRVIG